MADKIKVMIVDDSAIARQLVSLALAVDQFMALDHIPARIIGFSRVF
jgi:hypothetical protein